MYLFLFVDINMVLLKLKKYWQTGDINSGIVIVFFGHDENYKCFQNYKVYDLLSFILIVVS